jgi:hypothetical protein
MDGVERRLVGGIAHRRIDLVQKDVGKPLPNGRCFGGGQGSPLPAAQERP